MATTGTLINKFGRITGWNDVQVVVFGRALEGIQELSYDDNMEVESVRGAGGMPIGYGEGEYKANCSMTILAEELQAMLAQLPAGKRIHEIAATDVPVLYTQGDKVVKDVIRTFKFTGIGKQVKSGDKAIWIKMPCFCSSIDWQVQ